MNLEIIDASPSPYPSPRKRGEGILPLPCAGEGWGRVASGHEGKHIV